MKIYFSGVGKAQHIQRILDHPACPRGGEHVQFGTEPDDEIFSVRSVYHTPDNDEYDVNVVVGDPIRT
ncbi:hypothetical protein [Mycolicibacterium fortuitum]|uniref:hypothetical protein n=1 Tax=Mycolicibacterium fortuitum TaxID=1766 RepID=UPI003AAF90B9